MNKTSRVNTILLALTALASALAFANHRPTLSHDSGTFDDADSIKLSRSFR